MSLSQATQLQTRYMELFTLSGDYYKYLGELHKNMEELKVLMLYFAAAGSSFSEKVLIMPLYSTCSEGQAGEAVENLEAKVPD